MTENGEEIKVAREIVHDIELHNIPEEYVDRWHEITRKCKGNSWRVAFMLLLDRYDLSTAITTLYSEVDALKERVTIIEDKTKLARFEGFGGTKVM